MSDLKVSVFQICSNDSFEDNSNKILELLKVHDLKSVDLCVFPENALYINIDKELEAPKISLSHPFFEEVRRLAKDNDVTLHLGTLPMYRGGKPFNSTVLIDNKGLLSEPYDKVHLFAAEIGPLSVDESVNYSAGQRPSIIDIKGWTVGLSVCFDLRFSELYALYAKENCDLILVPSAFFKKTGEAHWETLLKARAIESQCYVVAPGQVGVHKASESDAVRKSYGHSLFVHPWGNVLEDMGKNVDVASTHTLYKEEIQKFRSSVKMKRKL